MSIEVTIVESESSEFPQLLRNGTISAPIPRIWTIGNLKIGSLGIAVESAAKPLACLAKPLKTLGGVLNPVSFSRQFPKSLKILERRLLGLFCSTKCPGDAILQTYDLVRALRDAGVAVIGGFHSPMEKECLDLLLRGNQPIVICPAGLAETAS